MTVTDAELVQWIEDAMLVDPRLSGQAIHVSADNGVVTLDGAVQTDERKQVALAIAGTHPSCRGVVDRVAVVPPGRLADAEIARHAQAALDTLAGAINHAADVAVADGVATLRGVVPTEWERAAAADVVLAARGVRHVVNALGVAGAYDSLPPAQHHAAPRHGGRPGRP